MPEIISSNDDVRDEILAARWFPNGWAVVASSNNVVGRFVCATDHPDMATHIARLHNAQLDRAKRVDTLLTAVKVELENTTDEERRRWVDMAQRRRRRERGDDSTDSTDAH